MKRFQILLSIFVVAIIVFATSCESKSGKRQKQMPVQSQVKEDSSSGSINNELPWEERIGNPIKICYNNEIKTWDLVLRDPNNPNGNPFTVEITSSTAMKIISDTTIVAVMVKDRSVILLR